MSPQTESPGASPACFSPLFAVFAALLMTVSRCWVKICPVEWMKLGSIHRPHLGFCTHMYPDLDKNVQVPPRPAYSLCRKSLPPVAHLPQTGKGKLILLAEVLPCVMPGWHVLGINNLDDVPGPLLTQHQHSRGPLF